MAPKLLVLDDDEAVAELIGSYGDAAGYDSRVTTDAALFFQHVEHWAPTHIVLDLVMPGVDGMEILGELSRAGCMAKIILVSGVERRVLFAAQRSSVEEGLDVVGTLTKPFSPADLIALLQPLGAGKLPDQPRFPQQRDAVEIPPDHVSAFNDLHAAIEGRQLFLVYQPKIRCSDRGLAGVEALVRWQHPERGLIAPSGFVPFAESYGLIDAMTRLVIDLAFKCHASDPLAHERHIAINLSAKSLSDRLLPNRLLESCALYGVDPKQVVLEVTETAAMADPIATISLATRLRLKGFRLSIDDFGIGYSSLAQLARLPFSELKVDATFVSEVRQSSESRKIVAAMVGLGHSLGMTVTAEGVSDQETLTFLRDTGCDYAQGYFIGRPQPHESLKAWRAPAYA